jgi:hypothetical protein
MGEGDDDPSLEKLHLVAKPWLKKMPFTPVNDAFKLTAKELEILLRPTSSYSMVPE